MVVTAGDGISINRRSRARERKKLILPSPAVTLEGEFEE